MRSSMIITLLRYACNYSTGLYTVHWRIDLYSVLIPLCISKPHLDQTGTSTRVADHTCAWTHRCKNGVYHYFKRLCTVVISNLNPLSEYWCKYPTLKLSSLSCSSALILAHTIKNKFNSTYCSCLIVRGSSYLRLTTTVCVQQMLEVSSF